MTSVPREVQVVDGDRIIESLTSGQGEAFKATSRGWGRGFRKRRLAFRATGRAKRNFTFFNVPVGVFITIDRRLRPGQWADLGGYIDTLALLARGRGLDTCPQVLWIRMHKIVRAALDIPPEQMLYCGMAIGYGDRRHRVNSFRTRRAETSEFRKFFGFL